MSVLILYIYIQYRSAIFFLLIIVVIVICYSTLVRCAYNVSIKGHDDELVGEDYSGGHETRFVVGFFLIFLFICVLLVLFIAFSIGPLPIALNTLGKIQLKFKRRNTGHSFALCDVGDIIIIIIIINDNNNN